VRDTRPFYRACRRCAGAAGLALIAGLTIALAAPDEGWIIERFAARITIQPDGTLDTREGIDVDFRSLSRRGIFRDLHYRFAYDQTHDREYEIALESVTTADGRPHQVLDTTQGEAVRRFRIGDPNRTISGKQTYRIAYRTAYGLNGFDDRDELFWNATGTWPVTMARTTVDVVAPAGAITKVACFQGPRGSKEPCTATISGGKATFSATRPLTEGEQMTIVAALRKGAVANPVPKLVPKRAAGRMSPPLDVREFGRMLFEPSHTYITWMVAAFGGVVLALGGLWWKIGRDRQAVALHQAGHDAAPENRVPLFGATPIGVEFQPPDNIRPAQMGLLVDERADTLDVTATIIDLAVRGYLSIKELPKQGWFGKPDWRLTRLKPADANLLEYERIVFDGLFNLVDTTDLSALKNRFYRDLEKAKSELYKDAVARKWFPANPNTIRTVARVLGLVGMFAGLGVTIYLAQGWGAGLVGLPFVAGGLLLTLMSGAMPRRTAKGTQMMRRTLGFAKYIRTAETHQQAFAERANLFTEYLPHAIVFRCADKWAAAFKDIDVQQATAGWYAGTTQFNAASFSHSVGSFSSSVSSAIASTPGGSGSSGFSGGGSSGGGGGGGGGGSW
jgi:uncharacterized membrane protein YgcG